MKNVKQALSALILIIGAFMITGCPGPHSDPSIFFTIAQERDINYGEIRPDKERAVWRETVTITALADSGYEAVEVKVRNTLNHPVDTVVRGPGNTWILEMPASNVTITATFLPTSDALRKAVDGLTPSSDWDEFNRVNTLVKKVQGMTGREDALEESLAYAIDKLAGEYEYSSPSDKAERRQAGQNVGLVLQKMREEDMTKWVTGPLALFPESRNAGDVTYSTNPDGEPMPNVTKIYYVRSRISGEHPTVREQGGWVIKEIFQNNNIYGNVNLWHVRLIYRVGTLDSDAVIYNLLLCPVAHYNVTYESGVTGSIYIVTYAPSQKEGVPGTVIQQHNINHTMAKEFISDAGATADSPNSVNMYTVIYTVSSDIVITVTSTGPNASAVRAYRPWDKDQPSAPHPYTPPGICEQDLAPFEKLKGAKFFPSSAVYDVKVSWKNP